MYLLVYNAKCELIQVMMTIFDLFFKKCFYQFWLHNQIGEC